MIQTVKVSSGSNEPKEIFLLIKLLLIFRSLLQGALEAYRKLIEGQPRLFLGKGKELLIRAYTLISEGKSKRSFGAEEKFKPETLKVIP